MSNTTSGGPYFDDVPDDPNYNPNAVLEDGGSSAMEIFMVVFGTWVSLVTIVLVAYAISHYSSHYSFVVYDLCTSSEGVFFYQIKVRVSRLPKEIIDGSKFMTLDLLGTSGQFITRLVVPFNEALKNKQKAESGAPVTVSFKIGRKRRLPDIGRIRVDHELWKQSFMVHFIDIKDVEAEEDNLPRTMRCNIEQNCTMLTPAEVDVRKYQADQVFLTDHTMNQPGQKGPRAMNLTLTEGAFFYVFTIIIVMAFGFWCPELLQGNQNVFSRAAVNGVVSGVIATVIGIACLVMYKFWLKRQRRMCGTGMSGWILLLTILSIVAIVLTIVSGVLTYNNNVNAITWAWAIMFGGLIVTILGISIGVAIEIMSRKRVPLTANRGGEESTTSTQQPAPEAAPAPAPAAAGPPPAPVAGPSGPQRPPSPVAGPSGMQRPPSPGSRPPSPVAGPSGMQRR